MTKTTAKKYELLPTEEKTPDGKPLYRVRALRMVGGTVKPGDLGGYIEKEENLSHEGECWVHDDAEVFGDAKVYGNAKVFGNAKVYEKAEISGNAWVCEIAQVLGNARVCGEVEITGVEK